MYKSHYPSIEEADKEETESIPDPTSAPPSYEYEEVSPEMYYDDLSSYWESWEENPDTPTTYDKGVYGNEHDSYSKYQGLWYN